MPSAHLELDWGIRMLSRAIALAVSASLLPVVTVAQTSTSLDAKIQAPELKAPERGSVVGQYASIAFGPGDVSRGAFTLPSPLGVPSERGALLAAVFPAYAPESGMSEWGMGWQSSLALTRTRVAGDPDFVGLATTGDDLSGPFGRLVRGTDGNFYPLGISKPIRVVPSLDTLTAYLADGTQLSFGAVKVTRTRGTYAWNLTEVRSVTGRKTRLDWTANASGRPFLASAWYGGVGDDYQYRVDLAYETVAKAFQDFRGGDPLSLDRRVTTVTVYAKNAQTGVFEERWHYELAYEEEGFGPGFYLASVQQVFRLGDRPPATRYTYVHAKDWLDVATIDAAGTERFDPSNNAVKVLTQFGQDALQADRTAPADVEVDGLGDLELARDYRLAHQTASGVVFEPLAVAATPDPRCYTAPSVYNKPRMLANAFGSDTTYVMDIRQSADLTVTRFTVCERSGKLVSTTGTASPSGNWVPGAATRLVDVNGDHKPDIVKVEQGLYRIALNKSVGTAVSFVQAKVARLNPTTVVPATAWVQEMNGDGRPDIVSRYNDALWVWHGKGNLEFADGQSYILRWRDGSVMSGLSSYAVTFVDANKDGLTDVLLSTQFSTYLFMNRGGYFQETPVPGLVGVTGAVGPYVLDVSGSGNPEVVYRGNDPVTGAAKAWGVVLSHAETGLLATADDGKGTVLAFEYGRAPAAAGGRQRQAVLSGLTVTSSGQAPVSYAYDYLFPTVHSAGKFLLGYGEVLRTAPLGAEWSQFLNEDRFAGLLVASTSGDALVPGLQRYTENTYDDATYQGIPWKRAARSEAGWRATDGTALKVADVTRTTAWWGDFCPAQVVKETSAGTLTIDTQYASLAAFAGLACLASDTAETGTHFDPTLNFTHETAIARNDVGLVTRVSSVAGPGDVWIVKDVTYTPEWLVATVTAPGPKTVSAAYDPVTRVLQRVTSPDGSVVEATQRDPLTSAAALLRTTRGLLVHEQHFAFDGQERLESTWDNMGSGSQSNPDTRFAYEFATATTPAAVTASLLVNVASGSVRETIDLLGAGGDPVAAGQRIPEGWAITGLTWRDRTSGQTRTYVRPAIAMPTLAGVDYPTLIGGASQVTLTTAGPFGVITDQTVAMHADVQRRVVENLSIDSTTMRLVKNARENGTFDRTTAMDASNHVLASWDEAGTGWGYVYDTLGRLREIHLADGKKHSTRYDAHGRVSRVLREGVATVDYAYDPTNGLLQQKKFSSPAGMLRRTVSLVRDGIGRVSREIHTDVASGSAKTFQFYFDGATPENPSVATSVGLLTAVVGDGYVKRLEYRADGKITKRTLEIGSWRTIVTSLLYNDAGEPAGQSASVFSGSTPLVTTSMGSQYDPNGRIQKITFGGTSFATYTYDGDGRLASVTLPTGDVSLDYDDYTKRPVGGTQKGAGYSVTTRQRMNARALPESETLQVGTVSLTRQYGHWDQRFLASSIDAQNEYHYDFDRSGLPTRIVENAVVTDFVWSGNTLVTGPLTHVFDDLGRTIQRGDLLLAYGPDGQVASATRGTRTWTFVHDEAGQRLAKLENGVPVAAYPTEGYLDATQLVEPIKVDGRTIGVLRNGAFQTVATDIRGTVLADADGTPRIASPFGRRDVHPALSTAIDYVEKGFDADLGLVRMGVRDYDPEINRFTTADPLYLEQSDRCVSGPVECNLYGYARSDPLSFRDPTGNYNELVHGGYTMNVLLILGATETQAAMFAISTAAADHWSQYEPTNITNWFNGNTREYHFNPRSGAVFQEMLKLDTGDYSRIVAEAIRFHGAQDWGFDGGGPHSPSWFGHPWRKNEDGTQSWTLSHTADNASRNPVRFITAAKGWTVELARMLYVWNGGRYQDFDVKMITDAQWIKIYDEMNKVLAASRDTESARAYLSKVRSDLGATRSYEQWVGAEAGWKTDAEQH